MAKALITLLKEWESQRDTVKLEDFAKAHTTKKAPATDRKPSEYQLFLKDWREKNPDIKGKEAIKQGAIAWKVKNGTQ